MAEPCPAFEPLDVVIVGAGISGIGMAVHLVRACPGKTFAILEGRNRLGGTWDLFRYPGVRSDSDMFTLGYEFEPWRGERAIATGQDILSYLEQVARSNGVMDRIRFGTHVSSADWDSTTGLWTITSKGPDGGTTSLTTRFLFIGAGYYDYEEPTDAAIPGIEAFAGDVLHPQFWPDGLDLSGRNVAVIGSGATAVTIVPSLAASGASVTMLQRTPSWYFAQPSADRIAQLLYALLPTRWAYRIVRAKNNALQSAFYKRSRRQPEEVSRFLLDHVRGKAREAFDPTDFTPPYGPWEQRLCFIPDSDLFDALKSGNARIVTGEIEQVSSDLITLTDGRTIPADTIVTATGLKLAVLGKIAVSLDGEPLDPARHWYYRSAMLSNVPNFAALFGYLNAAWTLRVDLVADRLCRLFKQMDAWGADVVTPVLPENHNLEEADPLAGFSSGYLQRGRHLIPKSATRTPWRLSHDYHADAREMREAPIDDGILRFERRKAR